MAMTRVELSGVALTRQVDAMEAHAASDGDLHGRQLEERSATLVGARGLAFDQAMEPIGQADTWHAIGVEDTRATAAEDVDARDEWRRRSDACAHQRAAPTMNAGPSRPG